MRAYNPELDKEGYKLDFIDNIRDLSARIQKQAGGIQTEEATKNAFVMPFISALGQEVARAKSWCNSGGDS